MGAAASSLPDKLSEKELRDIVGAQFDEALYQSLKDADGNVSKDQFLSIIAKHNSRKPYLLRVDVSPQGDNSTSRQIGNHFVTAFSEAHPDIEVRVNDLNANAVPHLDGEGIFAGYVPEDSRSDSMKAKYQLRLDLIKEITEAKAILVTTPMWNWSVPSVLKAYIDQLIIPGVLDPYGNKKLAGKKVTVVIAAGGAYGPGSHHPEWDFESGYLKFIFNSLGAEDIQIIRSEYCLAGIAPGMEGLVENKAQSLADSKVAAGVRAREAL
jgi:FMN-dependent NADH-azoreductase